MAERTGKSTAPTLDIQTRTEAEMAPTVEAGTGSGAGASVIAQPGDLRARYRLGKLLGRGGMGDVVAADDLRVGRGVAVKTLHPDAAPSPRAFARFLREARIQGRLEHPAVVPVHDLGLDEGGRPYFAMKRLSGTTLHDILAKHAEGDEAAKTAWPRRLLLSRFAEVCLAVAFAHTRGVVHRDLKPANIMLGDYGEVYVLDWGIAKAEGESEGDALAAEAAGYPIEPEAAATAAGTVLGTPGYMAPEQIKNEGVDGRSDVYSLGCVLFEILTLEALHPAGVAALLSTLRAEAARPAERRPDMDVPPELDDACARATAPEPAARFQSARDLHAAVLRYLDGDRDLARRRELSAEHAEAAEQALSRSAGSEGRAEAMRQAGRALALDPTNTRAQDLVGRMMLEPPDETPPEVKQAISLAADRAGAAQSRSGLWAYAAMFTAFPALLWIGVKSVSLFGAVTAAILGMAGIMAYLGRRERVSQATLHVGIGLDALTTVLVGMLYSPLLFVPMFATSSCSAFLTHPRLKRPAVSIAAACSAILLPIAAEVLGLMPRTFEVVDGAVVMRSWALQTHPYVTPLLLMATWLAALLTTAATIWNVRRSQETAERRLQIQAWHLRQLVPSRVSRATAAIPSPSP